MKPHTSGIVASSAIVGIRVNVPATKRSAGGRAQPSIGLPGASAGFGALAVAGPTCADEPLVRLVVLIVGAPVLRMNRHRPAHGVAFDLAQPAPNTGCLAVPKRPAQTVRHHRAPAADRLGLAGLTQGWSAVAHRKEQLGILMTTCRAVTPTHRCAADEMSVPHRSPAVAAGRSSGGTRGDDVASGIDCGPADAALARTRSISSIASAAGSSPASTSCAIPVTISRAVAALHNTPVRLAVAVVSWPAGSPHRQSQRRGLSSTVAASTSRV